MTKLVLTRSEEGKLCGLDAKAERAYAKFKAAVSKLMPGETLAFSYRLPRSPKHHAYFFKKLSVLLERQEVVHDMDKLREWLIVGAGFVDYYFGADGQMHAKPKSIAFDEMEETEFAELHRAVDEFLYTERAQAFLWPQLTPQQRWNCVESFMLEVQR
nr:MAG TPA: Protein of unknown function (DUF1367) [Caudoviricetes sp.]